MRFTLNNTLLLSLIVLCCSVQKINRTTYFKPKSKLSAKKTVRNSAVESSIISDDNINVLYKEYTVKKATKTNRVFDEILVSFGNGSISPIYQAVFDCEFTQKSFKLNYRVGSKRDELFQKMKKYPNQTFFLNTFLSGDTTFLLSNNEWNELMRIVNSNIKDQKLNNKFDKRPISGKSTSSLTLNNKGKSIYAGPAYIPLMKFKCG